MIFTRIEKQNVLWQLINQNYDLDSPSLIVIEIFYCLSKLAFY